MTREELCKAIFQIAHITGDFKLRSGQTSHEYFDKYRFEAQPKILQQVAKQLAPLVPKDTEVLAGLEMGGIPIATALSFETNLPVAFIRKEAKSYGTCLFAEGTSIKGKKTLVVEDVITTGGQVVESTTDLRKEGAIINHVLCVINRANGPSEKLQAIDINQLELFTMDQLKSHS